MRISELAEASGVSIATVKYYLRERLLPPGQRVHAREAGYGQSHLTRLQLVHGLVHVVGASIEDIRQLLAIVDEPAVSPLKAMSQATTVVPGADPTQAHGDLGSTCNLLEQMGFQFDPESPLIAQLHAALSFADQVGISASDEQLAAYGHSAKEIAAADFARIPWEEQAEAVSFAVLGTVVYEPVLLTLRRLAHHSLGMEIQAQRAQLDATADDVT